MLRGLQDTIVNVLTARDRNVIAMVLELLCTAVINFTFGMVISIFAFMASLPSLLLSYQPSWVRTMSLLLCFCGDAVFSLWSHGLEYSNDLQLVVWRTVHRMVRLLCLHPLGQLNRSDRHCNMNMTNSCTIDRHH